MSLMPQTEPVPQLKRVNIKVTPGVDQYFENMSSSTGISKSDLMHTVLADYVSRQTGITSESNDLHELLQLASELDAL